MNEIEKGFDSYFVDLSEEAMMSEVVSCLMMTIEVFQNYEFILVLSSVENQTLYYNQRAIVLTVIVYIDEDEVFR